MPQGSPCQSISHLSHSRWISESKRRLCSKVQSTSADLARAEQEAAHCRARADADRAELAAVKGRLDEASCAAHSEQQVRAGTLCSDAHRLSTHGRANLACAYVHQGVRASRVVYTHATLRLPPVHPRSPCNTCMSSSDGRLGAQGAAQAHSRALEEAVRHAEAERAAWEQRSSEALASALAAAEQRLCCVHNAQCAL